MTHCERHIQFVIKVQEMRTAQKQYFNTRNPLWLSAAKQAEQAVDAMLAEELLEINRQGVTK
jgi:hypothetical protein